MRSFAISIAIVCAVSTTAQAQWISNKQGGDFDDDATFIALTTQGDYAFGLRCTPGKPEVVYLTPDTSVTNDMYKVVNATEPKLRLKIDGGDVINLTATMDNTDKGTMRAAADGTTSLYEQIRDAKSSVAVVLTMMGKNFHEKKFNTRGSREAVSKLVKGCKLASGKGS
ncbi:MAG: hypothetical protein BGP05_22005 [Rhizobiales bacterium 62-47]|nr:hypothetical protein [Hyphomicrobiales bacterium]OJY10346.1 MAG: hypothetical protein BGP05_22005 [Rhizobiales bacterium 62-47]